MSVPRSVAVTVCKASDSVVLIGYVNAQNLTAEAATLFWSQSRSALTVDGHGGTSVINSPATSDAYLGRPPMLETLQRNIHKARSAGGLGRQA